MARPVSPITPRPLALAALAVVLGGCTVGTAATNLAAQGLSHVVTAPMSDTGKVPDTEFPLYGSWCGPGTPPPDDNDTADTLPPVDALDAACMKHDLCYREHGRKPACDCNDDLIWRVKYLQHHAPDLSGDARATMTLILGWFTGAPCTETEAAFAPPP